MMKRLMRNGCLAIRPDEGSFDLDEVVLLLLEANIEPRRDMLDT